jgi:hypothetical protein
VRRVSPSIARRRLGTISGDVCAVHLTIGGLAGDAWAWTTMDETGRICADGWRRAGTRRARREGRRRARRGAIVIYATSSTLESRPVSVRARIRRVVIAG